MTTFLVVASTVALSILIVLFVFALLAEGRLCRSAIFFALMAAIAFGLFEYRHEGREIRALGIAWDDARDSCASIHDVRLKYLKDGVSTTLIDRTTPELVETTKRFLSWVGSPREADEFVVSDLDVVPVVDGQYCEARSSRVAVGKLALGHLANDLQQTFLRSQR